MLVFSETKVIQKYRILVISKTIQPRTCYASHKLCLHEIDEPVGTTDAWNAILRSVMVFATSRHRHFTSKIGQYS